MAVSDDYISLFVFKIANTATAYIFVKCNFV